MTNQIKTTYQTELKEVKALELKTLLKKEYKRVVIHQNDILAILHGDLEKISQVITSDKYQGYVITILRLEAQLLEINRAKKAEIQILQDSLKYYQNKLDNI